MALLLAIASGCQTAPEPIEPTLAPPLTPAPPPATATAPAPPASPAGPTPVRATPAPGQAWLYLADFPAEAAIDVTSVTAHDSGFVAVGFEPFPGEGFGGRRNGVVWTSADGLAWTRSQPAALANSTPLFVAGLGEWLYVFGEYSICPAFSEEEECVDAPDAGVAAWRSADGLDWQRLAVPESMRVAIVDGVVVGLDRLVAHGSSDEDLVGVMWLSPDGERWDEVRDLAAVDPISTLGAGPERLVAFGTRYLPAEDDVETLAGYSDGGGFAVGQLPPDQRGVIEAATWGPAGFVAVGIAFQPAAEGAVALASADGQQWTAAGGMPADVGFHQLLPLASGYLAIGSEEVDGEFGYQRATAWFSADGLSWTEHGELAGGEFRQLSSSAVGSAGAIVFASQFEEAEDDDGLEEPADGSIHAWYAAPAALP